MDKAAQFKDLPYEFAYMDKDLSHRYMTNSENWILTVKTYLHNGYKDMNYFSHFNKIKSNLQNRSKVKDQNTYSLKFKNIHLR